MKIWFCSNTWKSQLTIIVEVSQVYIEAHSTKEGIENKPKNLMRPFVKL